LKRLGVIVALGSMVVAGLMATTAGATTVVTTPNGEWTVYPGQSTNYQASVQQPINADGSSNFKANGKAVIPVKFALAQGTGAFVFESIWSDNTTPNDGLNPPGGSCDTGSGADHFNDCSFLTWRPTIHSRLSELTELSAMYEFFDGDCAGGSLRWRLGLSDVATGAATSVIDIHYQPGAGGIGLQYCQTGTSGMDMTESTEPIVVTNLGGGVNYNITYAETLTLLGSKYVTGASLQLDSGWGANGDQKVRLTSATVGVNGTPTYTETFVPEPASTLTTTCPTAEATISITKVGGTPTGDVNEPLSIQPQDNNGVFRIVDCKYMYNLATGSLSGVGKYTVKATIGSSTFTVATFDLK